MNSLNEVYEFLKKSMTEPAYLDAVEAIEDAIDRSYTDGYADGEESGYRDGWDNGYDSGREYDDYYTE